MAITNPIHCFIQQQLAEQANADNAAAMQAYMKDVQPFYGVKTPERKAIFKQARQQYQIDTFTGYQNLILSLWSGEHREELYLALDVAEHYKKFRTQAAFALFEQLLSSADHWDTLDRIASNLAGPLVLEHRGFESRLIEWRTSNNMWLRRASLLAHLKHKAQTNLPLLEETILMLAGEKEFFIRKAIGWVLREYSKTDPDYVHQFVAKHKNSLSPLSQREALKVINKK